LEPGISLITNGCISEAEMDIVALMKHFIYCSLSANVFYKNYFHSYDIAYKNYIRKNCHGFRVPKTW